MFTGLVEKIGTVHNLIKSGNALKIQIMSDIPIHTLELGDSIAINGVCLTVIQKDKTVFTVEAVSETLERSNLSYLQKGDKVNLERALRADSRLGGHFVQGHVDAIGELLNIEKRDPGYWLSVKVPEPIFKFCVEKGSIALDGVSLTIASIEKNRLNIAIIPHTAMSTTLGNKNSGNLINIEVDVLGRYVLNFLKVYDKQSDLDLQKLHEWGF